MKKIAIIMGFVAALGIGCAVGTIAHNAMVPVAVAQTSPATAGACDCVEAGPRWMLHCVCNGLNCLTSSTGSGSAVSCVPN